MPAYGLVRRMGLAINDDLFPEVVDTIFADQRSAVLSREQSSIGRILRRDVYPEG